MTDPTYFDCLKRSLKQYRIPKVKLKAIHHFIVPLICFEILFLAFQINKVHQTNEEQQRAENCLELTFSNPKRMFTSS